MKTYRIIVYDFTSTRSDLLKRCTKLYHAKRQELEFAKRGLRRAPTLADLVGTVPDPPKHVRLDFMSVLHTVVSHFSIRINPIENISFGQHDCLAWLTIFVPCAIGRVECIIGDRCLSFSDAKQNMAEKAFHCLVTLFVFEIIDTNYTDVELPFVELCLSLERVSYFKVRERVLYLPDVALTDPILIAQDCSTPCGPMFQVPALDAPPLPPKKRKCDHGSASSSTVIASSSVHLYYSVPTELETVFHRAKHAYV